MSEDDVIAHAPKAQWPGGIRNLLNIMVGLRVVCRVGMQAVRYVAANTTSASLWTVCAIDRSHAQVSTYIARHVELYW